MEHTSNENIAAALKLLEEAALQKKDELKALMSDKYSSLRNLVVETEGNVVRSLTGAKDRAFACASTVREASVERARAVAHDVDQSVHQNPWPYLAAAAVTGLLLGFTLGRNRK